MTRIDLSAPKQKIAITVLGVLLTILACSTAVFAAPIKVGVYENKPLVFRNSQGDFEGLFVDVIRYIAEQEDWQLEFVPGTWAECLQRLERGENDLQIAIAVSDERKKRFSYPKLAAFTNWGRLYRNPSSQVDSLLDLEGKTVALVEGDIHARVFSSLLDKFGKRFTPLYVKEYFDVLDKVQAGQAEAGVVNRTYAMLNVHRYKVDPTPMIFNPIEVSNATPKGRNAYIREAFDRHLPQLLQDKRSIYYQSLENWFGQSPLNSSFRMPDWLRATLVISVGLFFLIVAVSMLLKRQVRTKTMELQRVNRQLSEQVRQLERAKNSLYESEKKYRTLLNNQNDAVFLHKLKQDGFSSFVEVNDSAVEHYGYSRDELLQLTPADIDVQKASHQEKFRELRAKQLEQGHVVFESIHRKKSGDDFPVEVNASLVEFNGERFILASVRDITERKLAEREKQLSNERFTTVLNSVDAGIYVADMKTYEILFMNRHLIEQFGQDFTGQTCWQAFHDEPNPCQHCSNDKLLDASGEPTGMHVWQEHNPKTGKHYMNYDRAIRWVDDRLVSLQISTDISEVINLETQLRQKYKMEAVGLMAGGIAHDFNNVLTIIMTNLELMLRKTEQDHPLRSRLEQAKSASQRAGELVKQILAYSRQGEQHLQPVQLVLIVEEALKLVRSTTPASIELQTTIDPAARQEMIRADSTQIEEVLINLCTNAIYAMAEKGLLSVCLKKRHLEADSLARINSLRPGDYLELTVTDTGSGMSAEVIEKIFDPFYTTKPAGQGTGMGLAISHGIIKKHKGYLVVESSIGKGSSFSIFLPTIKSKRLPQLDANQVQLPTGSEKILLIDDEVPLAESLADFLREHGYRVSTETDSPKALQRLINNEERYDLLISDQTMPELSGLELATAVLQHKPEQKIILCTGYSASMNEQEALQRGIKAVFMKPIDLPGLTWKVRKLLDEN